MNSWYKEYYLKYLIPIPANQTIQLIDAIYTYYSLYSTNNNITIIITKGKIIKNIPKGLPAFTVHPIPILFSTNIEESSGL